MLRLAYRNSRNWSSVPSLTPSKPNGLPSQTRDSSTSPAASLQQPQDSQTLKLPDGRLLGYAQYGELTGDPLLFFHGMPSSRLECAEFQHTAKKHNIHLIGVDRPGMGLSTFQPNRKILDWPEDVSTLADHLKLKTFRVIGSSGGGPYALACASTMPTDRLIGVGVLAGAAPWEAGTKGMSIPGRIAWNIWAWAPGIFRHGCQHSWVKAAQDQDPNKMARLWDSALKRLNSEDKKLLEDETVRKCTIAMLQAAFVQGADGATREVELLTQPWGFELQDIKHSGVKLWYGDKDTNTPLDGARYMASRLLGSKLHIYPGETHFMTAAGDKAEMILEEMMSVN